LPVAIAVLVAGSVDIEDEIMDDMVEDTIDEVAVGIGSPKRAAIVYRGIVLLSAQH
jgi:hypothetical protein